MKLAERLLASIEQVVAGFPRAHRYALGADIRRQAISVTRLTRRAWRDREGRRSWVKQLVVAVDDLQLSIEIGCQIRAFRSFAQFEALAREAKELGQQCGGWQRSMSHPKGQNAAAAPPPQRAKTLSTRAACSGRASA